MLKIIDNFLHESDFNFAFESCLNSTYSYGEQDNWDTPPTGMVSNISDQSDLYNLLYLNLSEKVKEVDHKNLYRMYINCFAPSENPYFHIDGESGITILYYPNKQWEIDDGGETQFLIDNEIRGILPIPNRLVMFDANIPHKATSFRNTHRFSIAIKYN